MIEDRPDAPRQLTWNDLVSRPRPKCDATVAYGPHRMQMVDVWLPAGTGPHRTVLMVHGGCWQTDIADRRLMDWVADDLRGSGYAVWNIDYRGIDREGGGYPGTFLDVAAAADRLREHGPRFGLETSRVVAVGHSAGGHLASWLAARRRLPSDSPLASTDPLEVAHVISLGGLPDLEDVACSTDHGCGTYVVERLIGEGRLDPYADTSIVRLFPLGVPHDLINGTADRIVPFRMAISYVARARAAGDRVSLHVVPGAGHVELVTPDTDAWGRAKRLVGEAMARAASPDPAAAP